MSTKEDKISKHEKILWELQKFAFEVPDSLIDVYLKELKQVHETYIQPIKDEGRSRN